MQTQTHYRGVFELVSLRQVRRYAEATANLMGIWILIRNYLVLKPRASCAASAVRAFLRQNGYPVESIETRLGLADASKLRINVIFPTDAVLARFNSSGDRVHLESIAVNALRDAKYPAGPLVDLVSFHSHETIIRTAGGYHNYFS